ncbi:MAG: hypothetical protein CL578_01910 [Alteromonadaceae bacterium]|jgi:hypothetical protein|uniref:Uncharacterized protein n=1 Tax=Paraglaciecola agarilytica NO2 TaxID=1125747 RepID=A0ABQ0IEW9_9ALTE|nr:hypothetical protein [Paraglaciecola agarilytica]MBN23787.1 hypothetical protein [Alteromonadaceae bacterium]GAC07813.1 hypothetical protein GAGA_4990 [Paraglaciecola agarilytica NO2]|tara:strand:- start:7246 stop:7707 length:462 start_codon:yes stop_codon:yes gene_type:complete
MHKVSVSLIAVSQLFLGLVISSTVLAAAKPITGVSCNGGFFVRTPDKHIHWIDEETEEHVQVYDKSDDIYAMAQCGTGVVTVFEKQINGEQEYNAIYSPNCMNIGSENGLSSHIYQGKDKINKIAANDGKLEIRFVNNTYLRGESCASVSAGK